MKWKRINESNGNGRRVKVMLDAKIKVFGDTVEEALENLHNKLLTVDANITDSNGNPNPEIVDQYNYWNKENEGDVFFPVYSDRSEGPGYARVELEDT